MYCDDASKGEMQKRLCLFVLPSKQIALVFNGTHLYLCKPSTGILAEKLKYISVILHSLVLCLRAQAAILCVLSLFVI